MSLKGYKKKWPRRSYLGPDAARETKTVKKPTRIRRRSLAMQKIDRQYLKEVRPWLLLPENQYCRVIWALHRKKIPSTQCHHIRGRGHHGELTLLKEFWLPVSAGGHWWIHQHPQEARALGFYAAAGDWNQLPK